MTPTPRIDITLYCKALESVELWRLLRTALAMIPRKERAAYRTQISLLSMGRFRRAKDTGTSSSSSNSKSDRSVLVAYGAKTNILHHYETAASAAAAAKAAAEEEEASPAPAPAAAAAAAAPAPAPAAVAATTNKTAPFELSALSDIEKG